jgi:antitoxin MazE
MKTVIKKWGNSLGIRIPSLLIKELSLEDGSFVNIKRKGKKIIIKPIKKAKTDKTVSKTNNENKEVEIGG